MIAFHDVSFAYDDQPVLDHISFNVDAGSTKAILGPSGCGKTTVLRLLAGLLKPQAGRIEVDGIDIVPLSEHALLPIRRKIGMVFQEGALFDSMTVGENVAMSLLDRPDADPVYIETCVEEALRTVDLEGVVDRMPEELSGGMRRRVAIARAIAADAPRILLYDEPTTGLDPIVAATICDLANKLKTERKITSVMVTHSLRDALKVGDEFMFLDKGRIVFEGDRDALHESRDPQIVAFRA